jgi:hypothetical protein
LFNFATGYGWWSLYFFVIALILVLASDLYVIHRVLPPLPELKTPLASLLSSGKDAISTWKFLLTKRALAFVSFHYKSEPPSVRSGQLDPILYSLVERLIGLRNRNTPSVQGPLETSLGSPSPQQSQS